MRYLGFLCVGLGIFVTAASLLGLVISLLSDEPTIKKNARKIASVLFPIALIIWVLGFITIDKML